MTMTRRLGTTASLKAWHWWTNVRRALPLLRQGMTQQQLADRIGTTQGNIAQSELGRYMTVRMPRLVRWLDALDAQVVLVGPHEDVVIDAWDDETAAGVGRLVRTARLEAGLSQLALGGLADCSKTTIQDLENNRVGVRVTTLAAVFFALGWGVETRRKPAEGGTE